MNKKILIFTEDWAGSGHKMAAHALQQALGERSPHHDVQIIGGLDVASPLLRQVSRASYMSSLRYAPGLWNWLYKRDKTWNRALKRPLGKVLGRKLSRRVIEQEQPDTVVCTHAYCLSALVEAKRRAATPFRLGSVMTDFHVNSFWVSPEIDFYVVGHQEMGKQLEERFGVDSRKIYVNGIPVRTGFAKERGRKKQEWKEAIGLKPNMFTILVSNGEAGYGDVEPLVKRLLQLGRPTQIVVVTGTNQALLKSLREQYSGDLSPHGLHLLGYVSSMWEWMGAADVIITKPGGLTCAESLAMGTPMILYQPLPGQEQKNSEFLQNQGVAVQATSIDEIMTILNRWQIEKAQWENLCLRTSRLGMPDSAYRTADLVLAEAYV
ncbi:MGDG synthase family glycosyltransferase [Brevibacillus dissolubilis]|uniref:MGDG synthase family glycosyltransferase n=1 Tax=Brevibacillus dissolubilis TaxID=1844116 RepID=UPI00111710CB|nr:glycosyltransferase [Brevibacillus dissolubilis]